ncbi:GNAT family N-acetyltransferase [Streptomyces boninensis]|uniref:GNAT family N-acetyltransferase n=1 Tax=Streptomyces boninensis TaxID=2039455 RepID=UPI003B226973
MTAVRAARPEDAAEVVRLRREMFRAMRGRDEPGPWEADARDMLRRRLAEANPRTGAYVIDGPDGTLAACAVGTIEERLPAPAHPDGRFGFVFNVCTDPDQRGRGYARAVTRELLSWFAANGVTRIDLHATKDAEQLYRDFGFAEHPVALSLDLPAPR